MLYAPRNEKPKRVQGAFVSDDEVSRVVEFLKEHSDGTQINEDISRDMESEVLNASIPIPELKMKTLWILYLKTQEDLLLRERKLP